MKLPNKVGFTIIETMLFLAITGLLIMGVLIGTGNSINTQRYRDSITSLQAFFQRQYSEVSNVNNDNAGNVQCYGNNAVPRGQSDCVILGRLITTNANSNGLISEDVIGQIPSGLPTPSDDVSALAQYNVTPLSSSSSTYSVEWGGVLVKPGSNNQNAAFSILILRSPLSGIIRTFIDNTTVVNNLTSFIKQASPSPLSQPEKVCINSSGLFAGGEMAVLINAGATSASGVETLGDNSGC